MDMGMNLGKHKNGSERMTKAERCQVGCWHIIAYWIADGFRMKLLANFLKHGHNIVPRLFDKALDVICPTQFNFTITFTLPPYFCRTCEN